MHMKGKGRANPDYRLLSRAPNSIRLLRDRMLALVLLL